MERTDRIPEWIEDLEDKVFEKLFGETPPGIENLAAEDAWCEAFAQYLLTTWDDRVGSSVLVALHDSGSPENFLEILQNDGVSRIDLDDWMDTDSAVSDDDLPDAIHVRLTSRYAACLEEFDEFVKRPLTWSQDLTFVLVNDMWKKCSSGPRDYDSVLSDEDDVDLSDEEPQEPSGSTVLAGVEVCVDFPGLGEQTLAFETLSRFTSGLTAAGADYSVSPDGSLAIRDGGLNVVTTSISSYYIFLSASENAERNWDEIVGLKSGQSVEYYVSGRGSADDAIFVRPSAAVAYLLTAMGMSPGGAISREGHIGPKCDIFRIHPSPSVPDYSRALHLIRSIDHDRVSGRAIFSNQHKLDSNASYGVEEFGGFDADASVQMAIGGATFSAEEFIQLSDLRGMAANCSLDFPAMGPQAEKVDDHSGGRIDWDGHSRVLCVAVTIDSLVTATDRCLADLGSGEKLCYTFAHGSRSAVYAWPMGAAAVTLRDAIMAKWVSFKGAPDGTVTRVHRVGRGRDYYNVSSENTPGATAVAELLREKFPRRRITVNGTVFSKGA